MSKTRGQHLNLGRIHLGKLVWDIFFGKICLDKISTFFLNMSETYLEMSKKMSWMVLNMSRTSSKKFDFFGDFQIFSRFLRFGFQNFDFFTIFEIWVWEFSFFFNNFEIWGNLDLQNMCLGYVCPSAPMSFLFGK